MKMSVHVARKRFGQHFLRDPQVIQRLVSAINPQVGQRLIEIGPGEGVLTLPVLKKTGRMDAIEIDRDLIPLLQQRCIGAGDLVIHPVDVLAFDFLQLVKAGQPLRLIGNLPYNISTPLIFHLLQYRDFMTDMHFMLQKEVVARLAALPGTRDYGRLSVMVQYQCQTAVLFHVSPDAFSPAPKVDSSVVRLAPHPVISPGAENYVHFSLLVREAFSHRRKTLRNSLKNLITDPQWKHMGINTALRPEQLRVEDYVNLSNRLQYL